MSKINIKQLFSGIEKNWLRLLTRNNLKKPLINAINVLEKTDIKQITPQSNDIFNFTRRTKLGSIKVIIIGQDPYPKQGDAHGYSFSSLSKKIPGSLRNIYKCLLKNGLINDIPKTSDLTKWADQGVLLLNSSLTTLVGKPRAHIKIWEPYTNELIKQLSNDSKYWAGDNVIFLLWGNYAISKKQFINNTCKVFEWRHPSPLAQRCVSSLKFINCDHFVKTNALLQELKLQPISWNIFSDSKEQVDNIIYTDGACYNNNSSIFSNAGYATYFAKGCLEGCIKYAKVAPFMSSKKMIYGTNNRGEGLAILLAVQTILKEQPNQSTLIVTDSMFWKNMIEKYMPKWEKTNIDFNTKKNPDITIKLHNSIKELKKIGTLTVKHVYSHDKNPNELPEHIKGNRIADIYAGKACKLKNYKQYTFFIKSESFV